MNTQNILRVLDLNIADSQDALSTDRMNSQARFFLNRILDRSVAARKEIQSEKKEPKIEMITRW